MLVNFESVDIEGFLSIGKAHVDLNNQGTVYVLGENNSPGSSSSNGAGKSTIFEAIIYALTGTTLRGTTDVVNMYWNDYCQVTLELTVDGVNYKIMRTRNHPDYGNNLKLWKDGTDISGDKLRKSESILSQELPQLTSSLISSVIILGQGLPNKFTDLSPASRKDRLEELSQSSDFINELKVRLQNFTNSYNKKLSDIKVDKGKRETEISINESIIKRKGEELEKLQSSNIDVDSINSHIKELDAKLEELSSKSTDLSNTKTMMDKKLSSYNELVSKLNGTYQSKLIDIEKYNKELKGLAANKCPTCGQYISSPEKVEELRTQLINELSTLNKEASELHGQIDQYSMNLQPLRDKISELTSEINRIYSDSQSINSKKVQLKAELSSVSGQIESINKEILDSKTAIEVSKSNLKDLNDKEGKTTTEIGILDYLSKKASREFRSYLLIGVVGYINNKLSNYGNKLFGTDSLKLILDNNKIFIQYDNRPYENLSGGEKQRADLAMQFSLRDMLINTLGFNCNLLVIDEGFDNLDESGVNSLISVINGMTNIDSVFTISHHTLSIPFDKTIKVVKDINKVSSIEEVI